MNRRIAMRNAVERKEDDHIFAQTVVSEDDKVNAVREQWLRESNCYIRWCFNNNKETDR